MNNFKVFISFKNTSHNETTEDASIASNIYSELLRNNIPTFYSNKSLLELGDAQFKDSIIKALEEATVFILVATKEDFIHSSWVKFEWDTFHTLLLNGKKGYIIPYILYENVDVHSLPMQLAVFETYDIKTFSIESLCKLVHNKIKSSGEAEITADVSSTLPAQMIKSKCESIYSSTYGSEDERLRTQANNTKAMDAKYLEMIYQKLGRSDLAVLDVGCAFGYVANSRFEDDDRVSRVICIDKNDECISRAKEIFRDSKQRFYNYSMSKGTDADFQAILKENGIQKFDLIFISMVAHHWTNPTKTLRKLRKFLNKNGYIYIRTCDDASVISYPDENNIVSQIHRRCNYSAGMSDREHGRKVMQQLKKSGFSDVSVFIESRSTVSMDYDQRMEFLNEQFGFRLNFFKKKFEDNVSDAIAFSDFEWMTSAIDILEDQFSDDNYFYSAGEFICFARNA